MGEGFRLTLKSLVVLVGFTLLILGAVEVGVAITGEGGSFLKGVPVLVLGLVIAGVPIAFAFRDMLHAERADERLASEMAAREREP